LTEIEISRLIDARNSLFDSKKGWNNGITAGGDLVAVLLGNAKVNAKVRAKLGFSTGSGCYSLWIVEQDAYRSWYHLSVEDQSNPREPKFYRFEW